MWISKDQFDYMESNIDYLEKTVRDLKYRPVTVVLKDERGVYAELNLNDVIGVMCDYLGVIPVKFPEKIELVKNPK